MTVTTSQSDRILKYLRTGATLTSLQALKLFDCMRLAPRIKELRDDGHDIETQTVKDKKTGKTYASYKLQVSRQPELF